MATKRSNSIVTLVHHYKRSLKKKPPAPAIARAVVTARPKAAPAETAITTSISRKEAKFLHWTEQHAAHGDVERDEETDEAITSRHWPWITSKLPK